MGYLPVLTFHRVLAEEPTRGVDPRRISVSSRQFRRHLRLLRGLGYRTILLNDYIAMLRAGKSPRPRTFGITFDDGYQDNLTLGVPILKECGFTAAVFAVSGELGGMNRWDDGQARLMTVTELQEWRRAGMEVGAHTAHHPHLTQLSISQARLEMASSKDVLEAALGQRVGLLAYPYGESNADIRRLVQEIGFDAAFSTDHAPSDHATDLFQLRRSVVFPRNNFWNIWWKAQRWYPHYQDWLRRGR